MALQITNAQRAEVLTQALPHIQKYYGKTVVVKYGEKIIFKEDLISIDSVDNIDLKYMLDNILNKWYA